MTTDEDRAAAAMHPLDVIAMQHWLDRYSGNSGPADITYMQRLLERHRLAAIAAATPAIERDALERAAAYLDEYAGGHYMAKSCAQAIRNLTKGA